MREVCSDRSRMRGALGGGGMAHRELSLLRACDCAARRVRGASHWPRSAPLAPAIGDWSDCRVHIGLWLQTGHLCQCESSAGDSFAQIERIVTMQHCQ